MEQAKNLLEVIVASLVENRDAVRIDSRTDEMGVLLTLHLAQEDMGKIVGRSGITVTAIRTILRAVGMKYNARVNLRVEEPAKEGMSPNYGT